MADGPIRRSGRRRTKSVPGTPGFRPGTSALVPVLDAGDEESEIQFAKDDTVDGTEPTSLDVGSIEGIDARTRIAWAGGSRNHAWQRALRLNGIARVAALKKVQAQIAKTPAAQIVEKDLYDSCIFPFKLFSRAEATELTNVTVEELQRDLRNREKGSNIIEGQAKGRDIYAGRHQQPLGGAESTLETRSFLKMATLLE